MLSPAFTGEGSRHPTKHGGDGGMTFFFFFTDNNCTKLYLGRERTKIKENLVYLVD